MNTTTDLVAAPRDTQIQPLPLQETRRMMHDYQTGLEQIVSTDDWQEFRGNRDGQSHRFLKRSGWRKIALWFGLDLEVIRREIDRDPDGRILRAHVIARATAPNGRFCDGDGGCSADERRFSKVEHDVTATAVTRATNRAISGLVGMGALSAEELADDTPIPAAAPAPPALITAREARELAQSLQRHWPSVDGFGFLKVLRQAFVDDGIDGVPKAAERAIAGLLFWLEQPASDGNGSSQTAAHESVEGSATETVG